MSSMFRVSYKFCEKILKLRTVDRPVTKRLSTDGPLEVDTKLAKDVILYKYENPRFYKILNIFAASQFIFWNYMSVFSFSTLRDAPVNPEMSEDSSEHWWRKINLGENKYKQGMAVTAFLIGYGILSLSWLFTLRSVRFLILVKGGQKLSFVTYTPFGQNRIMTVPLKNVSCENSRRSAGTLLPLKVKGRMLYYVLDMKGEFKNLSLFDQTAGLKRKLPV